MLTDIGVKRSVLVALNQWLSNEEFLYTSNESDFTGVYRASLSGGNRLFSAPGENVKDAALIEDGARRELVIGTGNPGAAPKRWTVLPQTAFSQHACSYRPRGSESSVEAAAVTTRCVR